MAAMVEKNRGLPDIDDGRLEIRSRQEAADDLNVSTRTFDRILVDGKIPFVMIGKRKKYLKRDIDVYIMAQRTVLRCLVPFFAVCHVVIDIIFLFVKSYHQ